MRPLGIPPAAALKGSGDLLIEPSGTGALAPRPAGRSAQAPQPAAQAVLVGQHALVEPCRKLVEIGVTADIFARPKHPYTQALLSAVPVADPTRRTRRILLGGDVPSPLRPPPGCPFHPRCPAVMDVCRTEVPPKRDVGDGHAYVCHLEPDVAPGLAESRAAAPA